MTISTVKDRLPLWNAATKSHGETSPFEIVRAALVGKNGTSLSYNMATGKIEISGNGASYVVKTQMVVAGVGLSGGGQLSGDVTLKLDISSLTTISEVDPSSHQVAVMTDDGGEMKRVTVENLTLGLTGELPVGQIA